MANPNTDLVIMEAIKIILPGYPTPNTRLAQVGGIVSIQSTYPLAQGNFPAVLLYADTQQHIINTGNGYDGHVVICVEYYDRWDNQPATIDAIRANINVDLQQMMTNLQHNSSLVVGTTVHAVSLTPIKLSSFKGELDWKLVPGLTLVKRSMDVTVNILPYDV